MLFYIPETNTDFVLSFVDTVAGSDLKNRCSITGKLKFFFRTTTSNPAGGHTELPEILKFDTTLRRLKSIGGDEKVIVNKCT
jgi:hypothetical protein